MNVRLFALILLATLLASACNVGVAPPPTAEPSPTPLPPTAIPTAIPPTPTLIPLPTSSAPAAPVGPAPVVPQIPGVCTPQVTANSIVNVRNGPGLIYSIVGALSAGETAKVDGRNADSTWWRIVHAAAVDGHGWVAASVTTTNCMSDTIQVVDTTSLPAPFVAAVTNVEVSVDPPEVTAPDCLGPIEPLTATAVIYASGPMAVQYSFEIEGYGSTKIRTTTFTEYGTRVVSAEFIPDIEEGNHWVRLWIEGLNMTSWPYQTRYRINCPPSGP